ncbi:MAG: 1-(5-phosphoribosyl)-5-[(5-phosphoribosylamino)methylideneamino]imidazole-4-carboxamide isomerase [Tepidisphaeraceae bacterium]
MPFTVMPSIDLRGGQVVRLKQGDYAQQINYPVDPVETARQFKAEGAEWLHVVDLDGAKEGRVAQPELIGKIIQGSGLRVQVGGGVRSTADVDLLIGKGAQRVVVGTKAIEDWPWFESLAQTPAYAHKLTLAIDAKEGMIATRGWTETSTLTAVDIARRVSDWPLAGLLYTDVAKDGMLSGPNLTHTHELALAGRVPVIASGGVGSIDDIRALLRLPVWGAIVGRSLYERKVNLREAIDLAKQAAGPTA